VPTTATETTRSQAAKPKSKSGKPKPPRILLDNPASAELFWELQDRNGNSVWIPRTTFADLARFDEKHAEGSIVVWRHAHAQGFDENHINRAVTAAIEQRGRRWRVQIKKHPHLDLYTITKLKGLRPLPTLYLNELKAIKERAKLATTAEDAMEIIAARDKLERLNAGLVPVRYARRGVQRQDTGTYDWQSLLPGEVRIYAATPRQLRGSFQRFAETRDIRNARLKTVKLKDGRTAVIANGFAGEDCDMPHWRDLSLRPMWPISDQDYADLTAIGQSHA
jgi:hypothetical protein